MNQPVFPPHLSEECVDDVERLLVEPLVLVALQLLDLVQAAALLDHLGYLGKRKRENHISAGLLMIRLVTDHRPGRLVDLEILSDLKIMVGRLQNLDRQPKLPKVLSNIEIFCQLEQFI